MALVKPPGHSLVQLHGLTVNYHVLNPKAKESSKLYEMELGKKKAINSNK